MSSGWCCLLEFLAAAWLLAVAVLLLRDAMRLSELLLSHPDQMGLKGREDPAAAVVAVVAEYHPEEEYYGEAVVAEYP